MTRTNLIRPDQIYVMGHGSDRPSFFPNAKKKKREGGDIVQF